MCAIVKPASPRTTIRFQAASKMRRRVGLDILSSPGVFVIGRAIDTVSIVARQQPRWWRQAMSIQPELSERFLIVENHHTGEILRMRRVRGIDGHTVLVLEGSLPPGTSGPPLHVHFDSRETILVKSGLLGVRIGRETFDVPP